MLILGRKIALTDFLNFPWGIPHGKLVEITDFFMIVKMSKNDIGSLIGAPAIHWNLFWAISSYFLGYNSHKHLSLKINIFCKTERLGANLLEWKLKKIGVCSSYFLKYPQLDRLI